MQKPKAESTTKTKNTPVAKVAPSPKPTAFVIPSIMVDPGTPKATLKATAASKPKESIVISTESEAEKEPVSAPAPIQTISTPEPEAPPAPTTEAAQKITEEPVSTPAPTSIPTISTPEPEITPAPTPAPAPKSTALTPGPAHKPSTAFTPFSTPIAPIIAPAPPVIVETPEPEEIIEIPEDTTDGGHLSLENSSSLGVGVPNESRRFSQLPPASAESPNAVKLGNFAVIPTPKKGTKEETLGSTLNATQESEKSRRFSQLPPASVDSPNAVKVGKFGVVPTPEKSQSPKLSPVGRLLLAEAQAEKSRRFSKLPPASVDSPNAVKLGSKFTMISREQAEK